MKSSGSAEDTPRSIAVATGRDHLRRAGKGCRRASHAYLPARDAAHQAAHGKARRNLNRFTEKSQEALREAQSIAERRHHQGVGVEHLAVALVGHADGLAPAILEAAGLQAARVRESIEKEIARLPQVSTSSGGGAEVYATPGLGSVLSRAEAEAKALKDDYTSVEHLLIAILEDGGATGKVLRALGLTREKLMDALRQVRGHQRVTSPTPEGTYQSLERYGRDLTQLAAQGKVDPVIGRDEEIRRVIQVLRRLRRGLPLSGSERAPLRLDGVGASR